MDLFIKLISRQCRTPTLTGNGTSTHIFLVEQKTVQISPILTMQRLVFENDLKGEMIRMMTNIRMSQSNVKHITI